MSAKSSDIVHFSISQISEDREAAQKNSKHNQINT